MVPVKLLHISYNLFAGTKMLSLSVYEPIAIHILLRGTVPQFDRGVELGRWVWYPVKLLHISYNLFAGTEMISHRLRANRNTNFAWGEPSPNLAEGSS